jgi:hypothetical protein
MINNIVIKIHSIEEHLKCKRKKNKFKVKEKNKYKKLKLNNAHFIQI